MGEPVEAALSLVADAEGVHEGQPGGVTRLEEPTLDLGEQGTGLLQTAAAPDEPDGRAVGDECHGLGDRAELVARHTNWPFPMPRYPRSSRRP